MKNIGFFTNTIDSIIKKENNYIAYFSLNEKITQSVIYIELNDQYLFYNFKIINNSIAINPEKVQALLLNTSKKLDREGKSFSKIQLKKIVIKDKKLFANLSIETSPKRIINKVTIKGYDDFPKSFLKNHFKINTSTIFNEEKIKSISEKSKNLQFVSEIKPPEVLFTKDSTFLYVYLKKRNNSSFDGLINFATNENGNLLLNGNINLELSNILNSGEKIMLFWNRIGNERQEFEIALKKPYIFNSKITPELSFSIYKQDSTFLSTKFESKLFYSLNQKINLALTYNVENSENLAENINNIDTFNNYFLGLQFDYRIPKNDFSFSDKISIKINPTIGERTSQLKNSNQFKIKTSISYIWDLDFRNSIFIRNENGYLNSETYLNNELFRIGGPNSIRGFNEQSIFVNQYAFLNLEYRFLTSEKSYVYTVTDLAKINSVNQNENLIALGLGFLFGSNNSLININTIVGKKENENFDFNNVKLFVNWKTFF
ncbi:hypothetical protein [Polaribacter sp. Hel_I_88]|uniref:hypothetical protein n=1 Tax=Polaribacter sp. Hel_I_88 TaxID=1250006 RepID=UPI00047E4A0A|nr:hypothetical protein [Polaribacter sp. Hel_I_88]